jgi:hypothetical protein
VTENFSDERAEAKEETPMKRRACRHYYENAEIFAALGDLSQKEIKRIQCIARHRLAGKTLRPGRIDADDLFMDAAIRTMQRKRTWTRGVSVCNHFLGVMRSIGHQRHKQAARYVPLNELVAASPGESLSAIDAQANVARLKEKLQKDAVGLSVLESMMDEMRPRNAQLFLGINDKIYWAARKRIRRIAEKLPGAPYHQRRSNRHNGHR